jgi:TonB family protein
LTFRLASSPRAAFLSEHVDGGVPAQLSSSTLPYTRRSAVIDELADAETRPPRSLLSTLKSSLRAAFLAQAVDSEAEAPGSSSSASPSPSRAAFISEALDGDARDASSSSALPCLPHVVRSAQPIVSEASAASSLPSALSSELVEGLRWLQASSLELKQHLDEIDKKMSRFEPHLDELTVREASPTKRIREAVEDAPTPTIGQFTRELVAKLKFVLQPYLSPGSESLATAAAPSAAKAKKDEWIPIPLGAYAQPRGLHGVPLCALLVLLVAGSVFLLQRYDLVPQNGAWRDTYTALVQKMQGPVTRPAEATSPSDGIIAGTETAVAAVANVVDEVGNPPTASPDKPSPSSKAFSELQAAAINFNPFAAGNPSSSHSARAENPTPAAITATPDYPSSNDREAPVNVAAPVMEANLVLSRVPAYPKAARADRVQGSVVMKAIISSAGTVQDVRVIEGDPRLRSAAADAIYKRRYRPYLLHGHPVEVATTITVDFKLNRSR